MKTIKELIKNKKIVVALAVVGGFLVGWLIFGGMGRRASAEHAGHNHTEQVGQEQIWTCSMHPQIRADKPGDCPICGMDLIPLRGAANDSIPADAMPMSAEAVALANIQTSVVSRREPVKDILLYGVVEADERSLQSQSAHVGGRIEKLFIDFTGVSVQRGQTLAQIYSPELITAQQELLEAAKFAAAQPALLNAAREKLKLWKLTDSQIASIEASGQVSPTVEITSNTSGIVMAKKVNEGDYVPQGGVLLDIADLSRVWIMFDAYEADIAFLKRGDRVDFTLAALPGQTFGGNISFIDPILDKTTRTAKVRVEVANQGGRMKPQMYATGRVSARLGQHSDQIVIPQSAVLWTGTRSVVYVALDGYDTPVFRLREVELGPSLGGAYVVLNGLEDGERIVTNGAFSIDSSAQLEGKRSMMNDLPAPAMTGHVGHLMPAKTAAPAAPANAHSGHQMRSAAQAASAAPAASGHAGHAMTAQPASQHAMLTVGGKCDMCKARIEKAAMGVKGVTAATWNASDKMLHLGFDPAQTSRAAISRAVAAMGHDTELDKADDAVYNALPACCKYR